MKRILLFLIAIFFTTNVFATGIGADDTTASCDNETLGQTSGTANIEVDWQPNTINISWYSDNTQLSVQPAATTCVYDDDLYLPSTQPTKTGYTFKGWKVLTVPTGYTRLGYITSDGNQMINTGIYGNENTAIETQFVNNAIAGDNTTRVIIGDNWSGPFTLSVVATTYAYQYMGNLRIARLDYWKIGELYTVYMDQTTGQTVNGTTTAWTGTPNAFTTTKQLTMFKTTDVSNRGVLADLYYLKILQNGKLVRNFIPARRDSDNVVGMWDTVTETFFTNAGSGSFVAGPAM
jgi:hypothetical protein